MKKSCVLLAGALLAGAGCAAEAPNQATGAPAASNELATASKACLENNRLWGFNVVDERTLQVMDRYNKRFTVHMRSGCVGLNNFSPDFRLVTMTSLGCVGQGDRVFFREPTLGQMSCTVVDVEPDMPAAKAPS